MNQSIHFQTLHQKTSDKLKLKSSHWDVLEKNDQQMLEFLIVWKQEKNDQPKEQAAMIFQASCRHAHFLLSRFLPHGWRVFLSKGPWSHHVIHVHDL